MADNPWWLHVTPAEFGLSTAAHLFIFLSGAAYGIVYSKLWNRSGFIAVSAKSIFRTVQIYAWSIGVFAFACGIVGWFSTTYGIASTAFPNMEVFAGGSTGARAWAEILLLRSANPAYIGILWIYCYLLLLAPLLLCLLRRSVSLAFVISALIYLVVQMCQAGQGDDELGFNGLRESLRWQLVFLAGMWVVTSRRKGAPAWLLFLSGATLVAVALKVWLVSRLVQRGFISPDHWLAFEYHTAGRSTPGTSELLHFLILIYFVASIVPSANSYYATYWATAIVRLGQHSLSIYAFTVVYAYIARGVLLATGADYWGTALAILAGLVLAIVLGWLLDWSKQRLGRSSPGGNCRTGSLFGV